MNTARVLTTSLLAMGVAAAASLGLACDTSANAAAPAPTDRGGDCVTCHIADYKQVSDPVHVASKPTTCAVCHTQDGWRPSAQHHEWWALTGAHETSDCLFCHGHKGEPDSFKGKGTPKECAKCHMPEYNSSTYPGHDTFPTTCADCHGTKAFKPSTYTPPPPPPAPVSTGVPLNTLLPGKPLPKGVKTPTGRQPPPSPVPLTPPPPPPPRTPKPPPPDAISRPSARR